MWHRWTATLESMPALSIEDDEALIEGNPQEVERVLASWTDALEAFRLAVGEAVQLPRVAGATDGPPAQAGRLSEVARLRVARARLRMAQGREAEAIDDIVLLLRMGFAVVRDPGSIVGYLRGLALLRAGLEEAYVMAEHAHLTSASVRALLDAASDRASSMQSGCANALRAEYHLYFCSVLGWFPESHDADAAIDVLSSLGGSAPSGPRVLGEVQNTLVDRATTRALYGEPLARGLKVLEAQWRWQPGLLEGATAAQSARWRSELAQLWLYLNEHDGGPVADAQRLEIVAELERVENPIGKVWVMMATGNRDAFLRAANASSAEQRVTATLLALRLASAEGRSLPAQLSEDLALEDPFSGRPLCYDRERGAVWSVGLNGVDDDGVSDLGDDGRPLDIVRVLSARAPARD